MSIYCNETAIACVSVLPCYLAQLKRMCNLPCAKRKVSPIILDVHARTQKIIMDDFLPVL